MLVQFENQSLEVIETRDARQWFMSADQAATAYGVTRTTVMDHLRNHAEEMRHGIERGVEISDTPGGTQQITVLYRDGVIKLGFFIRSNRAKAFRQFATDLIVQQLDRGGVFTAEHYHKMMDRLDSMENICRGVRDEVDELRATLQILITDKDEETIRGLIRRIKAEKEMDGRAIVGHVRKTLNVGSVYAADTRQTINVLKNLLGEGLTVVKTEE